MKEDVENLLGHEISQELYDTLERLAQKLVFNCYGDTLDPELESELVLYLIAHYASGTFGTVRTERVTPTYISYESVSLQAITGNPLSGTRWGQAVMALDPKGCLANGSKMRATLRSFTEYTEQ